MQRNFYKYIPKLLACTATRAFTIPGKSFVPPPEVDAEVVCLVPKINISVAVQLEVLEYICRNFFAFRRKMLANSAKQLGGNGAVLLQKARIDPTKRPQEVSIDEWCRLGNIFETWIQKDKGMMAGFRKKAIQREVEFFFTEELNKERSCHKGTHYNHKEERNKIQQEPKEVKKTEQKMEEVKEAEQIEKVKHDNWHLDKLLQEEFTKFTAVVEKEKEEKMKEKERRDKVNNTLTDKEKELRRSMIARRKKKLHTFVNTQT